jgi:hypothetical protein
VGVEGVVGVVLPPEVDPESVPVVVEPESVPVVVEPESVPVVVPLPDVDPEVLESSKTEQSAPVKLKINKRIGQNLRNLSIEIAL